VRFGKELELLDSPGIIPMRISDQSAAIKLAICDDIGERSYDVTDVAAILVQMLARISSTGHKYFILKISNKRTALSVQLSFSPSNNRTFSSFSPYPLPPLMEKKGRKEKKRE